MKKMKKPIKDADKIIVVFKCWRPYTPANTTIIIIGRVLFERRDMNKIIAVEIRLY